MAEKLAIGLMTKLRSGVEEFAALREMGISTVHLSYPARLDTPKGIKQILAASAAQQVEVNTVFCHFPGESYTDIPTIQATVGLVPPAARAARLERIRVISAFARRLGVARVAAHIGFIPEAGDEPQYAAIVDAVRTVCDELKGREQLFALETGQETARTMQRFIEDVSRENLRINFDPANMILYGNDEPIPALELLSAWVDGVHCKDGCWPAEPNRLGEEKPLGEGDVNIPAWVEKLISLGYSGPLTIEREIEGEEQRPDVIRAVELLTKLRSTNEIYDISDDDENMYPFI